jgi:hypothetical protein
MATHTGSMHAHYNRVHNQIMVLWRSAETDAEVASTERPGPKLWQPQPPILTIFQAPGNSTGARLASTAERLHPGVEIGPNRWSSCQSTLLKIHSQRCCLAGKSLSWG